MNRRKESKDKMKKEYFLLVTYVLMIAVASAPQALCYPSAGLDHLDPTVASVELEITGLFTETMIVRGSTIVNRSDPYNPGDGRIVINTEIIFMDLKGNSDYIGPVDITESLSKKSSGTVKQLVAGVDFPADSSFGVYIEIHTVFGVFHNDNPAFMAARIQSIPPFETNYTSGPVYLDLKNETDSVIGHIKHVWHKVGLFIYPGGVAFSVEKPNLLGPYISLNASVIAAALAVAVYVKRTKHRKEKK